MTKIPQTSLRITGPLAFALLGLASCTDTDPVERGDDSVDTTKADGKRTSFEAFKAQTYDEGLSAFLVEEDLVLDEAGLRTYYDRHFVEDGALAILVNSQGADKAWNQQEKSNLTFCVSSDFGADYNRVLSAVWAATSAWENAIDVHFVHAADKDGNCAAGGSGVRIPVRKASTSATFLGASGPRSGVTLNLPKFDARKASDPQDPLTLAGVVRHELGHSLGFPHEHERVAQSNPNCLIAGGFRDLTDVDTQSVMFYPSYVHPECNGRSSRTDLFLSQRDVEGAMKVYDAQSNLVIAGDTIYVRQVSTGDFYRWTGSAFQFVGGPGRQFVGTQNGVFALTPAGDNTVFLANGDTGWVSVGGDAEQLFQCLWNRICRSQRSGDVDQLQGNVWTTIGGPGKKFVYGDPAGLYAQSSDSVGVYQFTGTDWRFFGQGPFTDIIPATHGVYAIAADTGDILHLDNVESSTVIGGPGAQFDGSSRAGLVALSPDRTMVMERSSSSGTWRQIGGPAKRIARMGNGTVVALSPTNDLCFAPSATDWTCVGQP
ncbi:MAG: hypothetical protein RL385_4016 [Pseudomonadota bacterium]|jgi:hypothetical protein